MSRSSYKSILDVDHASDAQCLGITSNWLKQARANRLNRVQHARQQARTQEQYDREFKDLFRVEGGPVRPGPESDEWEASGAVETVMTRLRALALDHPEAARAAERSRVLALRTLSRKGCIPPYVSWDEHEQEVLFLWVAGGSRIELSIPDEGDIYVRIQSDETKPKVNGFFRHVPHAFVGAHVEVLSSRIKSKNPGWRDFFRYK